MDVTALIHDPQRGTWLAGRTLRRILIARRSDEVAALIEDAETVAAREGWHAVGFVSYEAAPGLDPKLVSHAPGTVPCAWFALFEALEPAPPPVAGYDSPSLAWQPSIDPPGYLRAIERIRAYVRAGDTYQVNFSYRLRADFPAAAAPEALFQSMVGGRPGGLGAFIETGDWAVCSASPELFFERRGRRVTSRPMKGTATRGHDDREDAAQARWLAGSAKNRAENLMITDMVRNDLGRIADIGSVATSGLFELEALPTVWQMTSTVQADTGASLTRLFAALFPAASITGAPKRRTMEIITELEPSPRGIYTGAIGVIGADGSARFNVAIRTAWVDKRRGVAEYGVGGGILWDSDATEEYAETRAKARVLTATGVPAFALLETLGWDPQHGFRRLSRHLARMAASARRFGYPGSADTVRAVLEEHAAGWPPAPQRVRVLLDRCGAVHVEARPLVPLPEPFRVALSADAAPVIDNDWVIHKTTHRQLYEQARADALNRHPDAEDVLLWNERGELTESTIANLVVDLDGRLVTPPLYCGLLPGVYRQVLLDQGEVVEGIVRLEDLRRARAVYLANSLRGRWPITVIPVQRSTEVD